MVLKIRRYNILQQEFKYICADVSFAVRDKKGETSHRASPLFPYKSARSGIYFHPCRLEAAAYRVTDRFQVGPGSAIKGYLPSFQNFQCKPACQSRRNPLPSVFRQNINSYLPHGITIRGTPARPTSFPSCQAPAARTSSSLRWLLNALLH